MTGIQMPQMNSLLRSHHVRLGRTCLGRTAHHLAVEGRRGCLSALPEDGRQPAAQRVGASASAFRQARPRVESAGARHTARVSSPSRAGTAGSAPLIQRARPSSDRAPHHTATTEAASRNANPYRAPRVPRGSGTDANAATKVGSSGTSSRPPTSGMGARWRVTAAIREDAIGHGPSRSRGLSNHMITEGRALLVFSPCHALSRAPSRPTNTQRPCSERNAPPCVRPLLGSGCGAIPVGGWARCASSCGDALEGSELPRPTWSIENLAISATVSMHSATQLLARPSGLSRSRGGFSCYWRMSTFPPSAPGPG